MHFCCFYGLIHSVKILIEEGDGLEQSEVSNERNETPSDVAQLRGFEPIRQIIKEAAFTWKAFQFMKDLYERLSEEGELTTSNQEGQDNLPDERNEEVILDQKEQVDSSPGELELENVSYESQTVTSEICDNSNSSEESELIIQENNLIKHELQNYLTMNSIPKPINPQAPQGSMDYYASPKLQYYCIPPEPRPLENCQPGVPKSNPVLVKRVSTLTSDGNGYIFVEQTSDKISHNPEIRSETIVSHITKEAVLTTDVENQPASSMAGAPKPLTLDATDENLVELLNDFKDNVYNMAQLELLFENWKSRSDVQNGMKERKKELKKIRDEYNKIQEELRKNKKTNVLFEKFTKFLAGGIFAISNYFYFELRIFWFSQAKRNQTEVWYMPKRKTHEQVKKFGDLNYYLTSMTSFKASLLYFRPLSVVRCASTARNSSAANCEKLDTFDVSQNTLLGS